MKNKLKVLLCITIWSNLLTADVIFDLGAQQFHYSVTDKVNSDGTTSDQYIDASYNLNHTVVSTGLISENGYYKPATYSAGHFGVRIKEPKSITAITFNMYCYAYDDGCAIELLGENGGAVTINFESKSISVGGERQTDNNFYGAETISGTININATSIDVSAANHQFSINKPDFNLVKINISLLTEIDDEIYQIDKLNSLVISTN